MITEVNPSARVQSRGVSELRPPGHCSLCGSADVDRRYVDPAIFFDWEGQIYFCNLCVEEMGNTIGMLTAAETKFLVDQNNKYEARNQALEKIKVEYDRLTTALRSAGVGTSVGAVDSDSILDSTESEGQHDDALINDESTISGETELTKSIKSTAERAEPVGAPRITSSNTESRGIGLGL